MPRQIHQNDSRLNFNPEKPQIQFKAAGLESNRPALRNCESVFLRQNDYWIIQSHGYTIHIKATRGLECLAFLLRHPQREFHVSDLFANLQETPGKETFNGCLQKSNDDLILVGLNEGCPILDAQAKAEYKRRLNDLRQELNEAEQFNDFDRAAQVQIEINQIAQHIASATGLGGRDRKSSSEAERARSAVTKRIKQSIKKITEASPDLGHHLAASIKTGYFCSYTPHPDRPVAWKF